MQYEPQARPGGGGYDIYLNVDGLTIPHLDKLADALVFHTNTYTKLERDGDNVQVWNTVFGPINDFFNELTISQQQDLAMLIISLHTDIIDFMSSHNDMSKFTALQFDAFIADCGDQIKECLSSINLQEDLLKFITKEIPLGDFTQVGKLPQHTKKRTFFKPEVARVLCIVLLCKLFSPLMGVLVTFAKQTNIDVKAKEIHCAELLSATFNHIWPEITNKLLDYIDYYVVQEFKEDMSAVFNNLSSTQMTKNIYCSFLVRNFVNVDLCSEGGNIITYVMAISRKIISSKKKDMASAPVRQRIVLSSPGSDDRAIAQMELDSGVSDKTFDMPTILQALLPQVITRKLHEHDLTDAEHAEFVEFFRNNPIQPLPLNLFLICGYFGHDFGGGGGCMLFHHEEFIQLVSTLSMVMFSAGQIELAHLVSAVKLQHARMVKSKEHEMLQLHFKSSHEYKNCRAHYDSTPTTGGGKLWDNRVATIVEDLVVSNYIYNTPQCVWDELKMENLNGQVIEYSPTIIREMCQFVELECLI